MMNSCDFMGRLVDDPKKFESDGIPRVVFTLAVDRDGLSKSGKSNADHLDFVAWRDVADLVLRKFKKGDLMAVSDSRAKVRSYVDGNGSKIRKTEYELGRVYRVGKSEDGVFALEDC